MTHSIVSVIIPTYARPDNLLRAIESVRKQTYSSIEIIVVDDNGLGTENQLLTEILLRPYIEEKQITYIIHEVNRNGSAARNTGFLKSKGDYINFLDDDDEFLPEKIEHQVRTLEDSTTFDASYCDIFIKGVNRDIELSYKVSGNLCYELLTGSVRVNTSSILFRRSAINDLNGWDERFNRHQDMELMVRFFRSHQICHTDVGVLLIKYSTPNVITRNPQKAIEYRQFFLDVMKDDIEKLPHNRKIYRYQYDILCQSLCANGDINDAYSIYLKIFSYGIPSIICTAKFFYYSIMSIIKR